MGSHRDDGGHGVFFDVWSLFYNKTPFLRWALWGLQDEAIGRLDPRPGERILDLGCGPARGSIAVRRLGARPVAADYAQGMTTQARRNLGPGSPVVRLDAMALPFADRTFDGILCTNSFHHYPDPVGCLREMRRVLRHQGRLVLADPLGGTLSAFLIVTVAEGMLFGLDDVHVHTAEEWGAMAREAGFSKVEAQRGRSLRPATWVEVFVRAVA